ncbi:hypothetical protein Q1G98_003381 [Vibrio alginolyticus]|uniref:Uncharacterized protein n=1 Tax=Vibrio parahaemolyticus TaxID=670 RepID=A0AAX1FPU2_VIBPH|nr:MULTISPECIES: hypothetical protein [Vibrio harveyi group]ELA8469889.1 hypothetical protein [Vibrio alginolyticus]MCR9590385.1 hypothetical protein [Vibrio alginolyticus]QHH09429.1 hypothetical protein EHC69_08570 [Vibrio parahaemolyticus]
MLNITIEVKKSMQPVDYKLYNVPVVLREGENCVPIEHWLVIKHLVEKKITAGSISIDRDEELRITELFKRECFTEFDKLGLPAVECSTASGELSNGIKHIFAQEWLVSKRESREQSRDNLEVESLTVTKKSNNIAICTIVVSAVTALLVALLTIKFT